MERSCFLNHKKIREAILDWEGVKNWQDPYAVTLTHKLVYESCYQGKTQSIFLDRSQAQKNMARFLKILNKSLFSAGEWRRRKGRNIPCFAVIEGDFSEGGLIKPHYHLLLGKPATLSHSAFECQVKSAWSKTWFGDKEVKLKPCYSDDGWIKYITKISTKTNYLDDIDWGNCFLPDHVA